MSASPARLDTRPANRPLYVLMALLLAVAIGVQVIRDGGWQPYQPANPVLWLRSGGLTKRLALGFDNLLADVYWIRAVVYYGGKRRGPEPGRNYDLLHPLLDLVTTLDPHFRVAYRFGAIFLTEAYPSGAGRPDLAVSLLARAVARDRRREWEYMQDTGFIYYWWLHDYAAAAQWFDKASRQPGAPEWLKPLAATTLARGGDRTSSRFLWRQILDSTDVDWLRQNAAFRVTQLDTMDQIDALNEAAARFAAREGRPPRSWSELVASERWPGVPVDPTRVPYVLDTESGRVRLSPKSPLSPLPTEVPVTPPPVAR